MSDLGSRLANLTPEKRALLARRLESKTAAARPEPIAIVGMGCRLPGGVDSPEKLWTLLTQGIDAVSEVPPERWNAAALYDPDVMAAGKMATRWGGFLRRQDLEQFDAAFFGISPREADRMEPEQRLLLETAVEAFEDAGVTSDAVAGKSVGVFVGVHNLSSNYFWQQACDLAAIDAYTSTGVAHSIIANRLSYFLDLRGPSLALDTACSSSLVAVHLACQSLRARESDLALAGGVNILGPEATIAFSKLQMMASDGRCKTFDARADGFVRGEGCGVIVLKRLSDAVRDGDRVLAVIRGSAVNQDGATNGLTAPNGLAQQAVIRDALNNAGLPPGAVSYVETHGTGTALGDPIEVEAISAVLGADGSRTPCLLGALKTNIGHLEAAAGIAGLIKAVLCLQHGRVPRNLHFTELNPHIQLAGSRFELPVTERTWERPQGGKRVAGVSSFGFGGTNAHVVLEEAETAAEPVAAGPSQTVLLPVSAQSEPALRALCAAWSAHLNASTSVPLSDLAYSAACRRSHYRIRRAVVGSSHSELAQALSAELTPAAASLADAGVVFVYSGQGPQWSGMGLHLYASEPVFKAALDRCDAVLAPVAGWSVLEELRAPEASSRLQSTDIAQPALFALQVALTELYRAWGIRPQAVVGHSVGEIAAAWAAGALALEGAAHLVVTRGRLMQASRGRGRMLAVELPVDRLEARLLPLSGKVGIAAINSPTSCVISGDADAVDAIERGLVADGIRCTGISAEYAFHSSHVERHAESLEAALTLTPSSPQMTWISTVTGRAVPSGGCTTTYWRRNMRAPVRFASAVDTLLADGHQVFLEIGPHPVLTSMVTRCAEHAQRQVLAVNSLRRGQPDRDMVLSSLARLYEAGCAVDWTAVQGAGRFVPVPTYQWDRRRHWIETPQAPPAGDRSAAQTADRDFYQLAWIPRGRVSSTRPRRGPAYMCDTPLILRRLDARRNGLPESPASTVAQLEHISRLYAVDALRTLCGSDRVDRSTLERVAPLTRSQRLLARLTRSLESAGWLTATTGGWTITAPHGNPQDLIRDVIAADPSSDAVARLLGHCGPQLAAALRGSVDPVSLLFSEDPSISAERVYTETPFARAGNALLAQAVAALVENLPAGRTIRVLEVGAGTRATTAELLPLLPEDRTEYFFTDLSSSFFARARRKFAGARALRYATFDAERDGGEQGFAAGQIDLIVAAHVLSETNDLEQTLERLRRLLSPAGALVLLEGVEPLGWVDLTFGLTDGWWRFTDTARRREHPLLTGRAWCELLGESGFERCGEVSVSIRPGHSLFSQSVIVARAASTIAPAVQPVRKTERETWCLFTDRSGVADALRRRLLARGDRVVAVSAGDACAVDGDDVRVRAQHAEDVDVLVGRLAREARHVRFVYLWPLDWTECPRTDAGWNDAQTVISGGAVHLAAALARRTSDVQATTWFVTRGVQSGRPRASSLVQSPLWGLGRVIALERPNEWGGLLDLDQAIDPESDAAAILEEIDDPDGEDQIAIRGGERMVARLLPSGALAQRDLGIRRDRAYFITGGTGGLGLQLTRWLARCGAGWLVLGSRRANNPEPAVAAAVQEAERLGAVVELVSVDVADEHSLRQVMDTFGRERPRLGGIIHAAGVIETHAIENLSLEALHRALRSKVAGAWRLHELSRQHAPEWFVLFSSGASVWGGVGLAHYGAANHFLDTLAHVRAASGLPVTCINWGWWEGGASTEEQHAYFHEIGLRSLTSARALEALRRAITSGLPQVTVASIDWPRFSAVMQARRRRPLLEYVDELTGSAQASDAAPGAPGLLERLKAAAPPDALAMLTAHVRAEVERVLGHQSGDRISDTDGFFDLGMDSITTVELRARLQDSLKCKLPVTVALEYPNVVALAGFIAAQLGLTAPPAAAAEPVRVEEEPLDGRSEDELAALLDQAIASAMELDAPEGRQ